jgi:hypothetical protein
MRRSVGTTETSSSHVHTSPRRRSAGAVRGSRGRRTYGRALRYLLCALLLAAGLVAVAAPSEALAATDTTAPVTTCSYDGGWRVPPLTLSFSATDGQSGVSYTEFSVDNGASWTRGTVTTLTSAGVVPIQYRSVDKAGNPESAKTLAAKVLGVALYSGGNATIAGSGGVSSP